MDAGREKDAKVAEARERVWDELCHWGDGFQNNADADTAIDALIAAVEQRERAALQGLVEAARELKTLDDDGFWCFHCDALVGYCVCPASKFRAALAMFAATDTVQEVT